MTQAAQPPPFSFPATLDISFRIRRPLRKLVEHVVQAKSTRSPSSTLYDWCLCKKGKFGQRYTYREKDVKRPREKKATYKPRREAWTRPFPPSPQEAPAQQRRGLRASRGITPVVEAARPVVFRYSSPSTLMTRWWGCCCCCCCWYSTLGWCFSGLKNGAWQ